MSGRKWPLTDTQMEPQECPFGSMHAMPGGGKGEDVEAGRG